MHTSKKIANFTVRKGSSFAPSSEPITFFDLDHTLIDANCSALFGAYLYAYGFIGTFKAFALIATYYLHKYRLLSLSRLHRWSFALLFKGKSRETFRGLLNGYVNSELFMPMSEKIKEHFEHASQIGDVYIVSASPHFIVEAYAGKFGVNGCYATEYCVDDKGIFSNVGVIVDGNTKAAFAKDMIEGRPSAAYSDDESDMPLLTTVDKGYVVAKDSILIITNVTKAFF